MKRFMTTIALAALVAGSAQAQVRQATVGGASGDPVYSLLVVGNNGNEYKCKPDIITENGVRKRICLPVDAATDPLFSSGEGIAGAAPALGVLLVAAAVAGGGGSSTSTPVTGVATK